VLFFSEIIECKEPIEVVSYKIGVCKVSPKGKDCNTIFQKLGYNGKTSIVLCKPKTGRMHQIRVHLQYLGKWIQTNRRSFGKNHLLPTIRFLNVRRLATHKYRRVIAVMQNR
jgi:23S rRNA-/tRNA-specific pseudouridylate synthase